MKLLLTAYGSRNGKGKGVIEIDYNEKENNLRAEQIIALDGKCNLVAADKDEILLTQEKDGKNLLETYDRDTHKLKERVETAFIYNYMQVFDEYLLLASFKNGVDALYDREAKKERKLVVHEREGKQGGRSHYIRQLKDGRIVSVENGLNQIYLYKNKDLEIGKVIDLEKKNIRLMSFADEEKTVFLNTEASNELLELDGESFEITDSFRLAEEGFSGGHTVSENGRYVFVGVRGEDTLAVFENDNGKVSLREKIPCGKTPRDLYYQDGFLFVSCTDENAVEVYEHKNRHLQKINSVAVSNPVTFEMN